MAKPTMKKVNTTPVEGEESKVEIDPAVLGETPVEGEENTAPAKEETPAEEKEPEVEPAEEVTKSKVDVDTTINVQKKPMENVKIKMAKDHTCIIAMERYDLKAGKTYVVPRNVKNILNKRGLLKPLDN